MPNLFPLLGALTGLTLILLALSPARADGPPKFSAFPVNETYRGAIAVPKIDAKKDPELRRAYREAKKTEVNAVGRYVLLKESCGSACVLGHLLDARTGRIIRMPFTISSWRETEDAFEAIVARPDSRLIVFRGLRDEEGINGVHYYTREADGSFKHLRSDDTDGNFENPLVVD